jgi:hypothetical protein
MEICFENGQWINNFTSRHQSRRSQAMLQTAKLFCIHCGYRSENHCPSRALYDFFFKRYQGRKNKIYLSCWHASGGNLKCINFMPKKQELCGLQAQVVMLSHRLHANEVFLILFNHTCEFFTATIQPNYGSVLIRSTYTTSY